MSEKQALIEALKKYQATVGKASPSNEGVEKTSSDGLVSEQRNEERPLKMVVINGVEIKVKTYGVKTLAQKKKEIRLREQEELLGKVEKVAIFAEKGKGEEKTFEEHYEEFEKEINELIPLEDKAIRPATKRKIMMKKKALREKFANGQVEKLKRKPKKDEEEVSEESESEEHSPILKFANNL
ncbi:protein MNN4-like [Cucumis melo var. makuwa]|uniref:Protein MNN4-like n=2 Tax=Cucumis melo TaxID=3656 RepID=A0A5D3C2J1_CUCMM|nr:protein MNN4-like [Cucumis melo var. makuwa]TYK06141.1 protein MNN4-like [Cucumis melo var. makuwa]